MKWRNICRWTFLAAHFYSIPLAAQEMEEKETTKSADLERGSSESPQRKEREEKRKIILKGIVLVQCLQETPFPLDELEKGGGILAKDLVVPGKWSELRRAMAPFLSHQVLNEETLQNIKKTISSHYEKSGYPFIIPFIPPQKITDGILQIEIQESCVGTVSIEGNRASSSKILLDYLSLSPGERIHSPQVTKSLQFMNRNPFRRVDAIYSQGMEPGRTDITLSVKDSPLYRFYAGADNTGVATTGRNRYFGGLSWNQVFGLDHTLFYQYTTSQNFKNLQAHTLQYTAFLSNQTVLNLYGGYSKVEARLSAPNRKNSGQSGQGSVRYIVPLGPTPTFVQEAAAGFDFKQTNNTAEFVDFSEVFAGVVNLTQFMASYSLKANTFPCWQNIVLEIYFSPGKWLRHQHNRNFNNLRPGAQNHWVYFRGSWKIDGSLPHSWRWSLLTRFQWSSLPLLPSEQLGIGGYDSVRGYEERELNADTGGIFSWELSTPSFRLFTKKKSSIADTAYFLFFFDGGVSYSKESIGTMRPLGYLLGTGPGFRYYLSSYLSCRFDLGFKLHNQAGYTGGSPMIHFSAIGSY